MKYKIIGLIFLLTILVSGCSDCSFGYKSKDCEVVNLYDERNLCFIAEFKYYNISEYFNCSLAEKVLVAGVDIDYKFVEFSEYIDCTATIYFTDVEQKIRYFSNNDLGEYYLIECLGVDSLN